MSQNPWKDVLIEALIVDFIYRKEHEDDPSLALAELIAWEQKIALDPAVSKEAADVRIQFAKQAIGDLGQIYGLLEEGKFDEASDYCRCAAEAYTQDLALELSK